MELNSAFAEFSCPIKDFQEGFAMSVSYKKKDLCVAAGISHASMAKLGKNENVTTDVLVKICTALQCDIGDIMELTNLSDEITGNVDGND